MKNVLAKNRLNDSFYYAGMTDDQLIELYVSGHACAFDELLKRNKTKIFSYIMYVVRNRETAEDVFQDTFLKIIARIQEGRYNPDGKFLSWATRIAHNEIMNHYRDSQNMKGIESCGTKDMLEMAKLSDATNAEQRFVNEQVYSDVLRMIDKLPEVQREVVFMRYFQNLSFKEIANDTGVSINTSLGRMRYALLNFRRMARDNNMTLQLM